MLGNHIIFAVYVSRSDYILMFLQGSIFIFPTTFQNPTSRFNILLFINNPYGKAQFTVVILASCQYLHHWKMKIENDNHKYNTVGYSCPRWKKKKSNKFVFGIVNYTLKDLYVGWSRQLSLILIEIHLFIYLFQTYHVLWKDGLNK